MSYRIAGIDVHKKMLAVVVSDVEIESEYQFERRMFGSSPNNCDRWRPGCSARGRGSSHGIDGPILETSVGALKGIGSRYAEKREGARRRSERCIWLKRHRTADLGAQEGFS